MAAEFSLGIMSPEREFYDGQAISLIVPSIDGALGIMAGRSNLIAAIEPGKLMYKTPDGQEHFAAVSNGLLKMEDNRAMVLVDTIEAPEEIDSNRARQAIEEAKEMMLQKRSIQDYYMAQARMARAMNRLKVASQRK